MRHLIRGGVAIAFVLYPFLVGYSLSQGHFIWISCLLIGLGVIRLLNKNNPLLWPLAGFSILCGGLSVLLKDQAWLKMYPVLMSVGALIIFASTLIKPPSMIERFARMADKDLPETAVQWTRNVTKVWCVFFALNAMAALYTVWSGRLQWWVWYNGFISYLLMGLLLVGEYLLRKVHQKRNLLSK
ncbi:intracellular septation protein A [Acinetobacter calcoaceticus]|uniref:Intracellular septation protein A n=1 Tax=Acinetobacter calcoaceticus TaxID=471 RepID=A0A4R1XLW5_ACICA|nr:intracellular septation protein A [Acinetobacter calcoaceticus]